MIKVFSLSSLYAPGRIISTLNINSYHSLTKFLQPANLTTYTISLISVQSRFSSLVTPARPSVSSSLQITNRSFTYASPYRGISSLLHPSTSFCSLSSWFTSSCAYHLITVITFALITYHCLYLPLQTQNSSLCHKSFPPWSLLFLPD